MKKGSRAFVILTEEESIVFTAIEKVRQQLTGDPEGQPHFQKE